MALGLLSPTAYRSTQEPWGSTNRVTVQNELGNVPRYDIDGRRYGNTLSDDMFAMKNPVNRANQHTPESYDYLPSAPLDLTPVSDDYNGVSAVPRPLGRDGLISRKKVLGDPSTALDWGTYDIDYAELEDDWSQQMARYHALLQQQGELANSYGKGNDLSDDMKYIKSNGRYKDHDEGYQTPRYNADYDPYVGTTVNYEDMSPQTLRQLTLMGVNRPVAMPGMNVDNANDTLRSMIKLYQYGLENGLYK